MNLAGKFLVFDGADGAGKSTLIRHFTQELNKKDPNLKIHITGEPTKGQHGQELRRRFISQDSKDHGELDIFNLFFKDRLEHQEEINNYIKDNYLVITDRYYHSTIAYQDIFTYEYRKKSYLSHKIKQPDVAIILTTSISMLLQRINQRQNKELFEREEKLKKVLAQYDRIIEDKWPYPIKKIDTSSELDSALQAVVGYIDVLFP